MSAGTWIERFSAPSRRRSLSPSPRNSTYPAPAPVRPNFNPRVSSLSLASRTNSSLSSLPAALGQNGSSLKQELVHTADSDDPLTILEKIIGSPLSTAEVKENENGFVDKPVDLVGEVEFGGLSLQDFLGDSTESGAGEDLRVEQESVQSAEECEKERDEFEELHRSILACDNVLQSIEVSLASFQKDLGLVSAEIETLQSRSIALNTRLENRRVVEKLLGPALEEVSISPIVVKTIVDGSMDENWLKALTELEKRLKIVDGKIKEQEPIKAATDIKPMLDNLVGKANERIRDYLVVQIKAIRSPNMNAQVIQQKNLAKHKDLYAFLSRHQSKLAEDIGQAYVNTMRWYYLHNFTRYREALEKLRVVSIDKQDTLGSDPSTARIAKPSGGPVARNPYDLGRRVDILRKMKSPALSSYLAEEDKSIHYMEVPFRNFNLALVDNVSAEYYFLTSFFSNLSFSQISQRCLSIFLPTFALSSALLAALLETNAVDCLGILLCIRLNQAFAFELQRRKVPVMEGQINALSILLWPKFQTAMDAHVERIRALASTMSSRSAASKLSFTGSSADISKQSTAPHFLTQRFGQFVHGILTLSAEAGDDEPVSSSLGRLRGEYEAFLLKASKSTGGADSRKRNRFLSNNYTLVETIIADTEGKMAVEFKGWLEDLRKELG